MTLLTALILAGNLPAEEARKNEQSMRRIIDVFYDLDTTLLMWRDPDYDLAEWEEIDDE